MKAATHAEIAEAMVAAMNAGDVEGVLAHFHPDVVVEEPAGALPYSGTYRGHDGFLELLGKIGAALDLEVLDVDVHESDGGFAARMHLRFTSQASGRSLETRVVEVDEVVDGQVKHVDVFYKDPDQVRELYEQG